MAETSRSGGANGDGAGAATASSSSAAASAGIPFYEKQRQHLKELITRKRALEKRLAAQEELILAKETEYLENTPAGNIIVGFDNYTKGTSAAAAQRRKAGLTDTLRVFSRSSVSYNPAASTDAQTPASTPASHAPTPMSSGFGNRDGASGAPTPTSATGGGGGGGGRSNTAKKNKRNAAAASAAGEDSETDSRDTKKVRTNFGARK
ncbi:hypothetical protein VTK26DRAFT_6963 [Humicola hyalothermophila]